MPEARAQTPGLARTARARVSRRQLEPKRASFTDAGPHAIRARPASDSRGATPAASTHLPHQRSINRADSFRHGRCRASSRRVRQRHPSLELALRVVREEPVRVVDDPRVAGRLRPAQRLLDRRLGPRPPRVWFSQPFTTSPEVRRQRAHAIAARTAPRSPPGRCRSARRLQHRAVRRQHQRDVRAPPPGRSRSCASTCAADDLGQPLAVERRPARAPARPRPDAACAAAVSRDSACVNAESAAYIGTTHTGSSAGSDAQQLGQQRPPELVGDVHAASRSPARPRSARRRGAAPGAR